MNNYTIVNGELYHHGVKGMKWGHRKSSILPTKPGDKRQPWDEKVPDPLKNTKEHIKKRKEEIKQKEETRKEINQIRMAKGKDKAKLIMNKIGKDTLKFINKRLEEGRKPRSGQI